MYNLDKAKEFLDSIDEPYAMIFDKDSDGISAASLIYKYLKQRGVEPAIEACKDGIGINISNSLYQDAARCKYVIFLDLPMDQSEIADRLPGEKILIVDHHMPQSDLNSESIVHINPKFDTDDYRPTAWLAYQITRDLNKKYVWLSGVGVVGDYGVAGNKELIDEVAEAYPNLVVEEKYNQTEMWSSGLGLLSAIITAAYGTEGYNGSTESYFILSRSESPEEITESSLMSLYNKYQGELERVRNEVREKAKYYPSANAYIYNIKSKYKVTSVAITLSSGENPDALYLFWRETAQYIEMSLRCQSGRINVAELVRELSDGIGNGGGHPQAAGGEVRIEHKDEFFRRLDEKLAGF